MDEPVPFEEEFPLEGEALAEICRTNLTAKNDERIIVDFDAGTVSRSTVTSGDSQLGRNDRCFCGSGKKYKKCCMVNRS